MGEFELIRQIFEPVARSVTHPDLRLGIGDDCAIQQIGPGRELVFSVDTLVEGVHFPADYDPRHLATRALGVAVSDLAAMGADPVCYTLALTLPEARRHWLEAFAESLASASDDFRIALAGGDTTRGPLTLTLQVHGTVPAGQALRRSGAAPGDLIVVSGSLGDAAGALACLEQPSPTLAQEHLLARYHRPLPRLALGTALRGLATSAIDVSDGLLADVAHLAQASGCRADLDAASIPLSWSLREVCGEQALSHALSGGDDYELCFTLPPRHWQSLQAAVDVPLARVGEMVAGQGVQVHNDGTSIASGIGGYDHFGAQGD
ncbi:thiamine-phosphate kinase [Marinobacter bohaiensis]|uniref:thiamine-phosphate kinase n=1 Tax=Marinobacter bohaiensis TaxID=2201898 RepID=UPI000DAB62CC|nr:thiamine-phosphate kinase [Marinobacter bohaiensis]